MSLASSRNVRLISLVVAWLLALSYPARANEQLQGMAEDPNQWVMPGGDYSLTRFSKLEPDQRGQCQKLKVAWTMSTGTLRGHEGQPLVVGDMMYFESVLPQLRVRSKPRRHRPASYGDSLRPGINAPPVACCDVVNRGVAYGDGKIFASTSMATIYALDAKTGKVLWTALNGDPRRARPSPPRRWLSRTSSSSACPAANTAYSAT